MGGGSSKINAGGEVVIPVKIRPLLLSRFEEFRKGRNGDTLKIEGTLSRKQLLKDGHEEEDGGSQNSFENEKQTQDKEKEKEQVKDETMVVRVISIDKISRVVPLPDCECECETNKEKEKKENNTEQDNQEKVFHVDEVVEEHEEENTRENEQADAKSDNETSDDDGDNETSDDDDEGEEHGRLVYPRSPSFRIYCIETENKRDEKEGSKNETVVVHKKSASADSIHNAASRNSNEVTQIVEIESTRKRKGNKMKKFGAVRTLLKVKSCYHPKSSCTGNDRTHVLVAKMN
ncbi:unnamed protein product [Lupinus luteus]|uniref:Uncharacterized protein n=1 Tax=Lupinus luteus TaxID=3873 RepID=A0AAV1Y8E2_LUPLU